MASAVGVEDGEGTPESDPVPDGISSAGMPKLGEGIGGGANLIQNQDFGRRKISIEN